MFRRLKRSISTYSRKALTWKSIIVFVITTWSIRCVLVIVYCFLLHIIFFQFTSCPTDDYWPKNFSNIESIAYGLEPTGCDNRVIDYRSTLQIAVFVPVHLWKFERRRVIRETWAKPFIDGVRIDGKRLVTKLIFVIGSQSSMDPPDQIVEKSIQERLKTELTTYGDILQLDLVDVYYNITLKIRSVLDWTSKNCPRAAYVIRADSDVVLDYANLLRFLFWLGNRPDTGAADKALVVGYCRAYDCVTRWPTSKTCLPRSVYLALWSSGIDSASFLPRYCFGFSYIFSMKFVEQTLNLWAPNKSALSAFRIPRENRDVLCRYWPLDDIFVTGYMAETSETRVPRLSHPGLFTYTTKFDTVSCYSSAVVATGAYDDDEELRKRWNMRQQICH